MAKQQPPQQIFDPKFPWFVKLSYVQTNIMGHNSVIEMAHNMWESDDIDEIVFLMKRFLNAIGYPISDIFDVNILGGDEEEEEGDTIFEEDEHGPPLSDEQLSEAIEVASENDDKINTAVADDDKLANFLSQIVENDDLARRAFRAFLEDLNG